MHQRSKIPLTPELIGEAALALISEEGRDALTMRAVAQRLGCKAMSLYHHVPGIEGVLDAVVDRLIARALHELPAQGSPQQRVMAIARAYLDLAERHPDSFSLLATRLWHTPAAVEALEQVLQVLAEAGLERRAALRQTRVVASYLNGAGLALAAWEKATPATRDKVNAAAGERFSHLADSVNAKAVRADLESGIRQLLAIALVP